MVEIPKVKISNVCSLSATEATAQSPFGQCENVRCAMCLLEVPLHKLKLHLYVGHFPFYRPYRCKKCAFKCGSVELFLKEHTVISNHVELEEVKGEKLPYMELLVDMFHQHSLQLHNGNMQDINDHLYRLTQNLDKVIRRCKEKKQSESVERSYDLLDVSDATLNASNQIPPTLSYHSSIQNSRQFTDVASRDHAINLDGRNIEQTVTPGRDVNDSIVSIQQFTEEVNSAYENRAIAPEIRSEAVEEESNLFSNFSVHNFDPTHVADDQQVLTSIIDSILDEKHIPVFSNTDGIDREKSDHSNQSATTVAIESCSPALSKPRSHTVAENAAAAPPSSSPCDSVPKSFAITCEFCQEKCLNKDLLKQHLLDNHCGGFQGFYCSECDFKSSSQRKAVDHCRTVHKSTKLLKRSKPTEEEFACLKLVKRSLQERQIDFDLSQYEN